MLILQILTLLNWIASTRPTTESTPALKSRFCRTEQECWNRVYCSPEHHHKCEVMASWCHADSDCREYGPSVFCELSTCIIDLKCSSSVDCHNAFKCKEFKCIAEIQRSSQFCYTDDECNNFQHCKDEECELNFEGAPMILVMGFGAFGLILVIFFVCRCFNLNRQNQTYVPGTRARSWK